MFFIEPHSEDNFFNREDCYGEPDDRTIRFFQSTMEFLHKSSETRHHPLP